MAATPPDVQLLGHAVLVQGPTLRAIVHLSLLGARERSGRDGVGISTALQEALQLMASAARMDEPPCPRGHADVREAPTSAALDVLDEITVEEVAEVLGLSNRHVRRLATSIGGRRGLGGAWFFDRGAVQTYRALREQDRN